MRIAVLVLGILGGLAAAFLGMKWLSDYNQVKELVEAAEGLGANTAELKGHVTSSYFLISGLVTGIVGGILAIKDKGKVGAVLMGISVIGAAVFAPKSLVFSCLLAVAAILALRLKPRDAAGAVPQAA